MVKRLAGTRASCKPIKLPACAHRQHTPLLNHTRHQLEQCSRQGCTAQLCVKQSPVIQHNNLLESSTAAKHLQRAAHVAQHRLSTPGLTCKDSPKLAACIQHKRSHTQRCVPSCAALIAQQQLLGQSGVINNNFLHERLDQGTSNSSDNSAHTRGPYYKL